MKKFNFKNRQQLQPLLSEKHNKISGVLFDHVAEANLVYFAIRPGMSQVHHYHKQGADIFIITNGNGTLRYGDVCPETGVVTNNQSMKVARGDVYFVEPYQMHALYNDSNSKELVFLNIAPASHSAQDSFDLG